MSSSLHSWVPAGGSGLRRHAGRPRYRSCARAGRPRAASPPPARTRAQAHGVTGRLTSTRLHEANLGSPLVTHALATKPSGPGAAALRENPSVSEVTRLTTVWGEHEH